MHSHLILGKQQGKKDTVFPHIQIEPGTTLDEEENHTEFA